jgi:hypothetical protein
MPTAQIIRERPMVAIPEVTFDAIGNCLWVLFEDDDYRIWCGIFGAGELHYYEGKTQHLNEDDYLVLVAGRLYRLNASTRSLTFASEERMLTDAVYVPSRDLVIACDFTNLFGYYADGTKWRSDRVSFDGIKLNRVDNDAVYGFVDDLNEVGTPFTLYFDGMRIEAELDRSIFGMLPSVSGDTLPNSQSRESFQ